MLKIYFNLHKRLFSVQEKVDGKWKITRHVESITLENAKFVVSKKGRQRVLREKRKNVHGYIVGEPSDREFSLADLSYDGIWLHYNPYLNEGFTTKGGKIFTEALFVKLFIDKKNKPQIFAFN